ncbi:SDR family NAD(P)-dependent oxidoreductase [Gemmobacter sp.]|uniref:SDR family NAD(P)-dependent oxidoreductase n=1 Tax=Gemmobacter sp. TaxID=1898957 RepID=UPI002AFF58A8|nr:SDR family oxidoreductase [Gemmobacter sp.]
MARLAGRRILLTGAGARSGIGRAAAEAMAREGARLALLDLDPDGVAELARDLGATGIPCDLSRPDRIAPAVAQAAQAMGGLDGLCNIAGTARPATVEATTQADWAFVLGVNLTAPFLVVQAALPHLRAAARADFAPSVVNVASGSALLPVGMALSSYVASKAGLVGLSKAMASELAPLIRVNAVCPGAVDTGLVPPSVIALANDPARSPYALKRAAQPAEIAGALVYLLSDEASYVTGTVLAVDGGRTFH